MGGGFAHHRWTDMIFAYTHDPNSPGMRRIKPSLSFWQDRRSTAALIKKLTTSRHVHNEEIFRNSVVSAFSNYADCCTWVPLLFPGFRWLKKRNKARAGPKRPPPPQGNIRKLGVSSPPVPNQPPVQHGPCLRCQPRLRVKTHSHTRSQTGVPYKLSMRSSPNRGEARVLRSTRGPCQHSQLLLTKEMCFSLDKAQGTARKAE